MSEGWSAAEANAAIDTMLAAHTWVKLHVGAPGAAGTANAAVETTRKQATWNAAAAGHADNATDITWPSVAGTEDFTHFSLWTTSTGGTFGYSGTITGNPLTAGDTAVIAAGDLDITAANIAA